MSKNKESEWTQLIQLGFQLLEDQLIYKQIDIVNKLIVLGYKVAPATLNKILNNNGASKQTLQRIAEGIQKIIESELGYSYNIDKKAFISFQKSDHWQPLIISEKKEAISPKEKKEIFHANGRLAIQQKIEFMERAQQEIIEVGVRLHTFVDYFNSRNKSEFSIHIEDLLKRGINIKLYLLDPESNESLLYFKDRGKVQEEELHAIADTRLVIKKLEKIKQSFVEKNYRGQMEVFSYKHIPYNYFLVTDLNTHAGQIMISHYIYGVGRADCPVLEFSKKSNENLYTHYATSLQHFIKDAKKLV